MSDKYLYDSDGAFIGRISDDPPSSGDDEGGFTFGFAFGSTLCTIPLVSLALSLVGGIFVQAGFEHNGHPIDYKQAYWISFFIIWLFLAGLFFFIAFYEEYECGS